MKLRPTFCPIRLILWLLVLGFASPVGARHVVPLQEVLEYTPEDAVILPTELRANDETVVMKLAPGVYDMAAPLRFEGSSPTIEGSGSGLGPEATILDFRTYSDLEEDARALSVRGPLTMRNLTIANVRGRATDLRTGSIETPSDAPVIFENVWFIDCRTVFKSTGGRTVGTSSAPMVVKNCVAAITSDYPEDFPEVEPAVNLRDTSYALFDHCDFFNHRELAHVQINDPEAAPNVGPSVTISNSILLAANGSDGTDATDDIYMTAGSLTIKNSVLWDEAGGGPLEVSGGGTPLFVDTVSADPLYVKVTPTAPAEDLDFCLRPGSPAEGLGSDGLNAGSVAALPTGVSTWSLYNAEGEVRGVE